MLSRNLLKPTNLKNLTARYFSATAGYKPVGQLDMVNNWTKDVTGRATSAEGKAYAGQLTALMSFYNKAPEATEIADVDFDAWRSELLTEGLVDKVEGNYNALMAENYNVESTANDVLSAPSKEYLDISRELLYHFTLWGVYYGECQDQLLKLEKIGNINDYLDHEKTNICEGVEMETVKDVETHNWFPGSRQDVNWANYYANQFAWGKKLISFYRHPCDDFKCGRATKNIMGR